MAIEQPEFALRRERLALRNRIAQVISAPPAGLAMPVHGGGPMNPTDLELGGFAAAQVGGDLWVSSSPAVGGESRISVVAAVLTWYAKRSVRRTPTHPAPQSGAESSSDGALQRLIIVDAQRPGVTARLLAYFDVPATVLDANGVAFPTPHLVPIEPRSSHLAFTEMFRRAGADVVIEHGVVSAEVAGLEVARVVDEDGHSAVRIGVGTHDRETFRMLHGDQATDQQLRTVVETVAAHRRPGADPHPLNLLAPERALRHRAIADPQSLDCSSLHAAEPPIPRANIKDSVPCCAKGRTKDGDDVVAVFVAGVDLDAVPFAADARNRLSPRARLLIVSETRNIVASQRRLASLLREPAEFVSA